MSLNTPHAEPLVDSTGNSWLDSFIHYGLIFGAIFQLICIFAVVLIPQTDEEKEDFGEDEDHQVSTPTRSDSSGRKNKHEKKKRR